MNRRYCSFYTPGMDFRVENASSLFFFTQNQKLFFAGDRRVLALTSVSIERRGHYTVLIKPWVLYRLWINYRKKNHDAVRLLEKFNHALFTVDSGTHHSQISVYDIPPTTKTTSRPTVSVLFSIHIPAGSVEPVCPSTLAPQSAGDCLLWVPWQSKRTWHIIHLLGLYSVHQDRMFCPPQEREETAGATLTTSEIQH